jgi:butyryl-CoA dehydrogenase
MNFDPDPAQQQWIKRMEAVCKEQIAPAAGEVDSERFIPREHFTALVRFGFAGLVNAEEHGGVGERHTTAVAAGVYLAKSCPSTFFAFLSHAWRVGPTLDRFGTDAIKSRYLPKLNAGQLQGGWALGERHEGNEKFTISSVARKVGEGYRLTGAKAFVAGASAADCFVVLCRMEEPTGPLAAFVVENRAPGLKRSEQVRTIGMRGAHVADLILDDCQVQPWALLAEGDDCERLLEFAQVQSALGLATLGIGITEACLDLSIERATSRKLRGKKLAKYQDVHFKIAQMKTMLDATFLVTVRAAYAQDVGENAQVLAGVAKLQAAETANQAADFAMSIFGGDSYVENSIANRFWRDAQFLQVAGKPLASIRQTIAEKELAQYE